VAEERPEISSQGWSKEEEERVEAYWRARRQPFETPEGVRYPSLPPARKEPDGRHWGIKHGIGWSNPQDCPDMPILMNALREGRIKAVEEAIQHYGRDLVAQVWRIARANEAWAQRPYKVYAEIDKLLCG
jgi:hypothetical protein